MIYRIFKSKRITKWILPLRGEEATKLDKNGRVVETVATTKERIERTETLDHKKKQLNIIELKRFF